MKKVLTALALLLCAPAWGQVAFPLFQPSNGIMVGSTSTYVTTSATVLDVTGLFAGICDATTFLRGDGECQVPTYAQGANPAAQIGLTTVNGVATTFMRSDAAPALDQSISPIWTGNHLFQPGGADALDISSARVLSDLQVASTREFSTGNLINYGLLVNANSPAIGIQEGDAASNNRIWDIAAVSEQLQFRMASDGVISTSPWMTVDRTNLGADQVNVIANRLTLSGDDVATLPANQTFSGLNTFSNIATFTAPFAGTGGAILIDAAIPQLQLYENDGAADNRRWDFLANGESLSIRARTDDGSGSSAALQIDRTGATVDTVTFPGTETQFTSLFTGPTAPVNIVSATPGMLFYETDAGTDEKSWSFGLGNGVLGLRLRADDGVSSNPFLQFRRTGTGITPGHIEAFSPFEVQHTSPTLWLYDTDGTSERRTYLMRGGASSFTMAACNDARSSCSNFMAVTTAGSTPTINATDLTATTVTFSGITTTASAANAFLDSGASNRFYRSTSSIRYKKDVEDIEAVEYDKLSNLRPITYHSKAEADDPDRRWFGLIAEEVAEVYPELVNYDEEGRPDGVQYERLAVLLLGEIQRLRERVEMLETAH